jgi:tripartite-type tricarboxylate transporter receptor subunit TctC
MSNGNIPSGLAGAVTAAMMATAVIISALPAAAQQADPAARYPDRPVHVIVPFAAGGGNDIFARLVGAKLGELLGQQFVIDNRPAAGGRVAAEYVTNQSADGYTLFVGASGVMSVAVAAYPKLRYHPTKSFIPLSMIASFPLVLITPIESEPKTVAQLVAYAKANPEKSNYGTTSPAFTVSTELLKLKTGMPAVALPMKSSAEMVQCVMQQFCLLALSDGPPAIPQVKADRVRALAVTGDERSPELPDVPSMAEAGMPEVNTKLWAGFFAPAGTPPAIAKKLEETLKRAILDPDISAKLRTLGVKPGGTSSDDFRKMIDADIQTYAQVVKDANLTFE